MKQQIVNFISRHFYNLPFTRGGYYLRRLGAAPSICDICDARLTFADYGYMCKVCGQRTLFSWKKYLPKFIWRFIK